MAKVTRREWYRRVNACWPAKVPALTPEEATKAAKRLYRFVTKKTWKGPVVLRKGRIMGHHYRAFSYTGVEVKGRRVTAMALNPESGGWRELVHLMSHYLERYAGADGHDAAHARLEMRMIKEVVRRGWLEGKLRSAPKPAKAKPPVQDVRYARVLEGIKRWEAKEKRARTALKKLRAKKAYYERMRAKREPEPAEAA